MMYDPISGVLGFEYVFFIVIYAKCVTNYCRVRSPLGLNVFKACTHKINEESVFSFSKLFGSVRRRSAVGSTPELLHQIIVWTNFWRFCCCAGSVVSASLDFLHSTTERALKT